MYRNQFMSKIGATLAGRDALYLNNLKFKNITKSRLTKDIDVSFKTSPEQLKEAFIDWTHKASAKIQKLRITDNGNLIVHILVPVINKQLEPIKDKEPLKLRIDCMTDNKMQKGVLSLNEIIEMKLNLKLTVRNRRLKDLVDVMNCLELYYPNGIEKKQLLNMIKDESALNTISEDDMKSCFLQARSFSNANMTEEQINQYISDFFSMISGLIDNGIPGTALFYGGYWNPKM